MRVSTVAALLVSAFPGIGMAAEFQIIKIADNNGPLDDLNRPAINEHGTVAFAARADRPIGSPLPPPQVYLSRNGALTPVYTSERPNAVIFDVNVNDSDTIAFVEEMSLQDWIYRGTEETGMSLVVDNSSAYKSLASGVVLGNSGKIAFHAELPTGERGIFTGPNPIADFVISQNSQYGATVLAGIRGDDIIEIQATTQATGTTQYALTDPVAQVYAFGPELFGGHGVVNDRGEILVNRFLPPEQPGAEPIRGLFTGKDPIADRLVDTTGPFSDLHSSDLNNVGTIVFEGILDSGGNGIFTGPDITADRVIATGDPLFGSTVARVQFGGDLTDAGQIAFTYELTSGERGVAVAWVPEPTTAIGAIALGTLMARRRRH